MQIDVLRFTCRFVCVVEHSKRRGITSKWSRLLNCNMRFEHNEITVTDKNSKCTYVFVYLPGLRKCECIVVLTTLYKIHYRLKVRFSAEFFAVSHVCCSVRCIDLGGHWRADNRGRNRRAEIRVLDLCVSNRTDVYAQTQPWEFIMCMHAMEDSSLPSGRST